MGNDCIPSEEIRKQRSALPTRDYKSPEPSYNRQGDASDN